VVDRSLLDQWRTQQESTEYTLKPPPDAPLVPTRTGETPLQRAAGLRDEKVFEAQGATTEYHNQVGLDLDRRAIVKARRGVSALLDELAARGFSWRDIARIAGVSVPAVRKWRTGGTHSPERRLDLARMAGLCDLLDEYHVVDPAGWLEMPLAKGVTVAPMDLYLAGRAELVVDAAANRAPEARELLDRFDPDWRQRYVSDFEVFEATDGKLSIRAKR
jgi:transcriptional regulator with XRE-family HTH domain